jgi:hypothetical protein
VSKPKNLEVWILYQNEAGMPGRVIGTFSTDEKAMNCKAISEEVGSAQWIPKQGYWLCFPLNKEYYFSVELSTVDRLVED